MTDQEGKPDDLQSSKVDKDTELMIAKKKDTSGVDDMEDTTVNSNNSQLNNFVLFIAAVFAIAACAMGLFFIPQWAIDSKISATNTLIEANKALIEANNRVFKVVEGRLKNTEESLQNKSNQISLELAKFIQTSKDWDAKLGDVNTQYLLLQETINSRHSSLQTSINQLSGGIKRSNLVAEKVDKLEGDVATVQDSVAIVQDHIESTRPVVHSASKMADTVNETSSVLKNLKATLKYIGLPIDASGQMVSMVEQGNNSNSGSKPLKTRAEFYRLLPGKNRIVFEVKNEFELKRILEMARIHGDSSGQLIPVEVSNAFKLGQPVFVRIDAVTPSSPN